MCAQVWERISRELLAYLDVYSEQRCRLLFCRPPSSRTYFASIEEIIYWLECVTIHACLLGDLLVSFLFDSHFHCCLIAIINKCGTYPIWNRLHKFRHRYLLGKHMKQRGPPPKKKKSNMNHLLLIYNKSVIRIEELFIKHNCFRFFHGIPASFIIFLQFWNFCYLLVRDFCK